MIKLEAEELKIKLMKRAKEKGMKYIAIEYCNNPDELIDKSNGFEWHYQTFNDEKTKEYFEDKGIDVIALRGVYMNDCKNCNHSEYFEEIYGHEYRYCFKNHEKIELDQCGRVGENCSDYYDE